MADWTQTYECKQAQTIRLYFAYHANDKAFKAAVLAATSLNDLCEALRIQTTEDLLIPRGNIADIVRKHGLII